MKYKEILVAAAVSVLFAGAAQAVTMKDPSVSLDGLTWDFGNLSGHNVSNVALDVATDLPKIVEFVAMPTAGSLSIEVNNSGFNTMVLGVSNLLGLLGNTQGSYVLSYGLTDLYTVIAGSAQSLAMFSVASGSEESLVWSWELPANITGQVSSNFGVVPLPAAGWMLLAGVGGIAALRRRKKA